jgi:16S rRNA (cytosine1402-N4)-methyltransferase
MNPSEIIHVPVLCKEVVESLPDSCHFILDGTLGHGGHARAILSQKPEIQKYFGVDQDPNVIGYFMEHSPDPRLQPVHLTFVQALEKRKSLFENRDLDAIFLDLGTSQLQLRDGARGFSFLREGPLDMRMNPEQGYSLGQWLKEARLEEISEVLRNYGEEKFHHRIASKIIAQREKLETTLDLARLIEDCLPRSYLRQLKIHGATRSFQAFRIHINEELKSLDLCLDLALEALRLGGRLLVISFHSLEDRIVKNRFKDWEQAPGIPEFLRTQAGIPKAKGRRLNRKVMRPTPEEIKKNESSRSARLRVFVKEGGESGFTR